MALGRVITLVVFGAICGAAAPDQSTSYVCGRIEDPSSAVSGAAITVVNEESGFRHAASSSDEGAFCGGPLAPGLYKLTVRKDGFRTMIRFHVHVDRQEPAR